MKPNRTIAIIFVSLFGIIYLSACSGDKLNIQPPESTPSPQASDGEISFAAVKPLFNQYCVECHKSSGMPDLSDYSKAQSIAAKIGNFVSSGFMPQQGSPEAQAITEEDKSLIISWVNAGAPLEPVKSTPGSTQPGPSPDLPPILQTLNQCMSCHGENGISTSDSYPNLAGQDEAYLRTQLLMYKDGRRNNQTMNGFAKDLSQSEIQILASFFASIQPNKDPQQALADTYVLLYEAKDKPQGVLSCAGCHANLTYSAQPLKTITDKNGKIIPVPSISGQKSQYIVDQFANYFNKTRDNEIMQQIATQHPHIDKTTGGLNIEEVKAIADYFSKLPVVNVND